MPRDMQGRERFQRPELFLSDLLKRAARGAFVERDESPALFFRALVVAVDTVGGALENDDGSGSVTHDRGGRGTTFPAVVGPRNPRGSLKARILSDGYDQFVSDDRLRVFWPLFPEHSSLPVKPGEHVYVMFEDADREHGLWVAKVSGHEDVNLYLGERSSTDDRQQGKGDLFGDPSSPEPRLDTDRAASERLVRDGDMAALFGE